MLHALLDFLRTLTTPERLIHLLSTVLSGWLGYATLTAIVFAETGLLVGFVLPGDSLLFTIGVVAGAGQLNLPVMMLLLIAACLAGDWCGYLLGRRAGPAIFNRPDSRFFKQEYLQAHQRVLCQARRQDHHLREVRAGDPHLCALRRRRREHALSQLPFFRRVRRNRLGDVDDRARLSAGRNSAGAAQFREIRIAGHLSFRCCR